MTHFLPASRSTARGTAPRATTGRVNSALSHISIKSLLVVAALAIAAACGDRPSPVAPSTSVAVKSARQVSLIQTGSSATGMTTPNSGDAASSMSISTPSDTAEGDFLLAQITFEKGADAGSDNALTPSGWTRVVRTNYSTDLGQAIYYRFATALEPLEHTFPFSQPVKAAGGILRYTGVDTFHPIADSSAQAGPDLATLTAPSVNAAPNTRLVAFFGFKKKDTTLSVPGGMSGIYNFQNPQDVTIRAADQTVGAGATGSRASNPTPVNTAEWVAHLIALRGEATVEVKKVLDPTGDGGKFNLWVNGTQKATNVGHNGTTGKIAVPTVPNGNVTVHETAGASTDLDDYISKVVCDSSKGSTDPGTSHSFTIDPGEDVICTITNVRKPTLTVTKVLSPANDSGKFNLLIDTTVHKANAGHNDTTGAVKLAPGTYVVSETAGTSTNLADYTAVISGGCNATTGSITLAAGQNASCTITNTRLPPPGFTFYLHNRSTQPSGNTARAINLPMDTTVPTNAGALPNYDTNADSFPGRLIQKDSGGVTQTAVEKYQNWISAAFASNFVINKATGGEVKIWTAMKDNDTSKVGRVHVYVRDCPGTPQTSCVLLGDATYVRPAGGPFSVATIAINWTFAGTSHTVTAGRLLEVKIVVESSSGDDMWIGYDTVAMPAWFKYQ